MNCCVYWPNGKYNSSPGGVTCFLFLLYRPSRERERGVRLQQRSRTKGSKKKREKIALLLAHAAGVLNGNEVHGNGEEEEEGDKIEKENFIRL